MNFLLARVAKLVAHARLLKSTIWIKIGDMLVKLILMGRKCNKSSKYTHTHTQTIFPTKLHKSVTLLTARSMLERDEIL